MVVSALVCPEQAPAYYPFTLHVIAAITAPINLLCLYLLWFHLPRISKYRYCLAYLQIVTFIVEVYMSWVAPGYYFFPMMGGYNTSRFTSSFLSTHYSVVLYFFVFCFELPAMIVCFVYRHEAAMELNTTQSSRRISNILVIVSSHTFPFFVAICLLNSQLTYEQKYDILKTDFPNCLHTLGIEGFGIYDWRMNYWTLSAGASAVIFIFVYGFYGIGLAAYTIYVLQKLRQHMSRQTYTLQKTAIFSLCMQCVVPFFFIICPFDIIVFVIINDLHEYQEFATDTMFIVTSHSAASSITMIVTNKNFRAVIWRGISKFIPNKVLEKMSLIGGESHINSVAPTSINQHSLIT